MLQAFWPTLLGFSCLLEIRWRIAQKALDERTLINPVKFVEQCYDFDNKMPKACQDVEIGSSDRPAPYLVKKLTVGHTVCLVKICFWTTRFVLLKFDVRYAFCLCWKLSMGMCAGLVLDCICVSTIWNRNQDSGVPFNQIMYIYTL